MSTQNCILSLFAGLLLSMAASAAEVRGIILKVDTENQLTIEGRGLGVRGAIMTFQLDKDTQIQMGRKPATAADLSSGRRVRVTYEIQGHRRVALVITLVGGPLSSTPSAAAPDGGSSVSGILRRVNFTEREIVVVSPGKADGEVETTLSVPEDAKITRDQKAISFDDLKEGDQVLVQAEKHDGKLVAKSIQLGVVTNANTNAESGQNSIEKIRRALKLIDMLSQMMDQKSR
jgi:Domain of unknown function (DUF5666)